MAPELDFSVFLEHGPGDGVVIAYLCNAAKTAVCRKLHSSRFAGGNSPKPDRSHSIVAYYSIQSPLFNRRYARRQYSLVSHHSFPFEP